MADNFISAVKAHTAKLRQIQQQATAGSDAPAPAPQQPPVVKIIRQNPNLLRSRTGNGR